VYATVTTVFAAVSGLLGTVFGTEIAQAFPFHAVHIPTSYRAITFWLSLVIFGFLFFGRQRHDDRARKRLEAATANIRTFIETLPPHAFRSRFAFFSETVLKSLSSVSPRQLRSGVTADGLRKFIQLLLFSIANLAFVYDDQPAGPNGAPAIYSANVMLFVPPQSEGDAFPEAIRRVLRFVAEDTDLHHLRGVLMLRQDLSATTATTEPANDSAVPVIALPVPAQTKHGARSALLPGAPNAFAGEQEVDGYVDSRTLPQWCMERGDFAPSMQEELKKYFNEEGGEQIRSFISRRLLGTDGTPIGVLNLHADRVNILGPAVERREIFQAMLTPFFVELGQAVALLIELERRPA
jgi:hypothetical protein